MQRLKNSLRAYANLHRAGKGSNIFIFSTPRSGSTWLMELIRTQPGFKSCEEPLNLRNPAVRCHLGLSDWEALYRADADAALEPYFSGFCRGTMRFMNANPLNAHHRLVTDRIVFKILHGGEDRINWFARQFNGRIVLLLRHPLAVALSREALPRLETLVKGSFQANLTTTQRRESLKILDQGSHLQKGVLSWCLQNAVPLNQDTAGWIILTYEQLVLEPEPLIAHLAQQATLPRPDRMLARLHQPSGSHRKSDKETKALLAKQGAGSRQQVVQKWRRHVSREEGEAAMAVLNLFGLDHYRFTDDLPASRLWLRGEQCVKIQ